MSCNMRPPQRRPLVPLRPALTWLPPPPSQSHSVTFYDLPAELRIEIYKLALQGVVVHILSQPPNDGKKSHPLTRTSQQVRNEVLPMIHSLCPIRCTITDFNFDGLVQWVKSIPPDQEAKLLKNEHLEIFLTTTGTRPIASLHSMRQWLNWRSDQYRPQPNWTYKGPTPHSKVCADLRRKAKRMNEPRKQQEFFTVLNSLGVQCGQDTPPNGRRSPTT